MEQFDPFTDRQALRWIFSLADGSNRPARWRLIFMGHQFRVRYKRGAENTTADAITRLSTFGDCPFGPDLDISCLAIEQTNGGTSLRDQLDQAEFEWMEHFPLVRITLIPWNCR